MINHNQTMKAAKTIATLVVLIFTETGRADPWDIWEWRSPWSAPTSLNGVAYGNGLFVAVGQSGSILGGVDGIHWDERGAGLTNDIREIAFGNDRFVATAFEENEDNSGADPDCVNRRSELEQAPIANLVSESTRLCRLAIPGADESIRCRCLDRGPENRNFG